MYCGYIVRINELRKHSNAESHSSLLYVKEAVR